MRYDLYVITDEGLSHGRTHSEQARQAILGGADVIQLRDKKCDRDYLRQCALEMRAIADKAGTTFIVNDRLDLALQCEADGAHIGQGDMPLKFARRAASREFIIGVSAGTVKEALEAERDGADYIGFGPIFRTASKDDAGTACGLEALKEARQRISIPIVAIGGINAINAPDVLAAGADGLAVISAVISQENIATAASALKEIIIKYRSPSRIG
ncbi:MAG TPA: thiamine phosphate synthase [Methanocella sp.]|nr:thiamine phosphate synthase [Methanocella sp.]